MITAYTIQDLFNLQTVKPLRDAIECHNTSGLCIEELCLSGSLLLFDIVCDGLLVDTGVLTVSAGDCVAVIARKIADKAMQAERAF